MPGAGGKRGPVLLRLCAGNGDGAPVSLCSRLARKAGAELLLFGHTHHSLCQQLPDGLWMLNPGASRSSYGLVLLEGGTIHCSICPQE